MNGYELSNNWFEWSFNNPSKIKPVHTALYMFAVHHCNKLGWKSEFGLPTDMVKEAIGLNSYKTYISAFKDLAEWGFIKVIQLSKNQHTANVISLERKIANKKDSLCFENALEINTHENESASVKYAKASPKQVQSTYQSKSKALPKQSDYR